jgi:hypothetical protein
MVTEGSAEADIMSVVGVTAMLIVVDAVWVGLPLSCTDTVKVDVPVADGTPEIVPADERVSPAGRVPDVIVHT